MKLMYALLISADLMAVATSLTYENRLDASDKITYPPARRSEQADLQHGKLVADPYRWLEDADSTESKAWVAAENALTVEYMRQIPACSRFSGGRDR
jgi:prolyl oligopeptidase